MSAAVPPRAEGYTDSKGYFFIELGNRNNGILQDASEIGGYGDINSSGRGGSFGGGSRGIGPQRCDTSTANCVPGWRDTVRRW